MSDANEAGGTDLPPGPEARPVLRVVRGEPSPAELAALIAVVAARSAGAAQEPPPPSAWADRRTLLRPALPTGPEAWRWSSFATGRRTRADW